MIKKFFKHRINQVVGAYCDGMKVFVVDLRLQNAAVDIAQIVENDEIVDVDYVFEVDRGDERWTLVDVADAPIDEHHDELALRAEAVAEKISVICSTCGWSTTVTAMCLNDADVITELDDLSNVPPTEIDNAVRYRIAAAGGFDIDNFLAAHVALDDREWMEGVAKTAAQTWLDAFRKNDIGLAALTAMPDGIDAVDGIDLNGIELSSGAARAVFAARVAAFRSPPNFFVKELERLNGWDFRKFAAVVAAVTLIGLSTVFGLDRWQYNQAARALAVERQMLDELERDRRMMQFIESDQSELEGRRRLLAELTKETFPWRSVLIHFGSFHVKGVWLNELRGAEDKSLELKCEALNYEAMSEFIKALEADREFFRHEPQIQSSQAARSGSTVEFTVRIPML